MNHRARLRRPFAGLLLAAIVATGWSVLAACETTAVVGQMAAGGTGGPGGGGPGGHGGGGDVVPNCGDGIAVPGELCLSSFEDYATGAEKATAVVLFDCDDDGDLDAVITHEGDDAIVALLNNGSGAFTIAVSSDANGDDPRDIAFGDLDGQGDLDIVVGYAADPGQVLIQAFIASPTDKCKFVPAGSITNDGTTKQTADAVALSPLGSLGLDLVAPVSVADLSDIVVRWPNVPEGTAEIEAEIQNIRPRGVALADIDGDDDIDVTYTSASEDKVVIRRNADGSFGMAELVPGTAALGSEPWRLAVGDVDGDGDADIVTSNRQAATISVLQNDGDGLFEYVKTDVAVSDGAVITEDPERIVLVDLDNDGDLDLVTANVLDDDDKSYVSVLLNDGAGTFSLATAANFPASVIADDAPLQTGRQPHGLAVGDVNGDGAMDIVTASNRESNNTSKISVLLADP